ncbi:MAG: hypothetical protein WCJ24_02375 [Candidatus Saccharibacteria bacterium]
MARVSLKRIQISKANTSMVISIALAAFMLTFTIIAGQALLGKRSYQNRVIGTKEKAVNQLQANIKATESLAISYKAFVSTSSNVLGGDPASNNDRGGDNAKIILDALPSQYDFPALASSLEKILGDNSFKVSTISGSDDELIQQKNSATATPVPVAIPFQLSVTTNLEGSKNLLSLLERSIRPIQVGTLTLSGSNDQLSVTISAQTYYQPGKSVNIETKVIK